MKRRSFIKRAFKAVVGFVMLPFAAKVWPGPIYSDAHIPPPLLPPGEFKTWMERSLWILETKFSEPTDKDCSSLIQNPRPPKLIWMQGKVLRRAEPKDRIGVRFSDNMFECLRCGLKVENPERVERFRLISFHAKGQCTPKL